jgi:hypothetical protein
VYFSVWILKQSESLRNFGVHLIEILSSDVFKNCPHVQPPTTTSDLSPITFPGHIARRGGASFGAGIVQPAVHVPAEQELLFWWLGLLFFFSEPKIDAK